MRDGAGPTSWGPGAPGGTPRRCTGARAKMRNSTGSSATAAARRRFTSSSSARLGGESRRATWRSDLLGDRLAVRAQPRASRARRRCSTSPSRIFARPTPISTTSRMNSASAPVPPPVALERPATGRPTAAAAAGARRAAARPPLGPRPTRALWRTTLTRFSVKRRPCAAPASTSAFGARSGCCRMNSLAVMPVPACRGRPRLVFRF